MSIDCWKCWKIIALFKIHRDNNDRERLEATRDWAREHVDTHRRGMAHGEVKDEVKAIANSNNGGKKCY